MNAKQIAKNILRYLNETPCYKGTNLSNYYVSIDVGMFTTVIELMYKSRFNGDKKQGTLATISYAFTTIEQIGILIDDINKEYQGLLNA